MNQHRHFAFDAVIDYCEDHVLEFEFDALHKTKNFRIYSTWFSNPAKALEYAKKLVAMR